jgi:hypothetical protein
MEEHGIQHGGHREHSEIKRENLDSNPEGTCKESILLHSSFLCELCALCVEIFGFYSEDFTGSPATTERYTSRTCSADRSHEYFWTSS